jgi:hypothetical protein
MVMGALLTFADTLPFNGCRVIVSSHAYIRNRAILSCCCIQRVQLLLLLLLAVTAAAPAVQAVPVWWAWVGDASFVTYTYAGLVRNEFEGLWLTLPAGATSISAGGAAANAMGAAARDALQTALAGLMGANSSSSSSNSSSSLAALLGASSGWQREVVVNGLSVVPGTIRVHFGSVGQLVALLLGFALGSSCLVVAATALLVRWKYR